MDSADREYLAMAKASTSGSAPWTANTLVWLLAPGAVKDSLDILQVSRTEYGIGVAFKTLDPEQLFGRRNIIDAEPAGDAGVGHAGVSVPHVAQAAAFAIGP